MSIEVPRVTDPGYLNYNEKEVRGYEQAVAAAAQETPKALPLNSLCSHDTCCIAPRCHGAQPFFLSLHLHIVITSVEYSSGELTNVPLPR